MEINIVSVDWDYFFPDSVSFDWGHREIPLLMETLWPVRYFDKNLETGELAKDVFYPNRERLDGFWDGFFSKIPPARLCIAESHASIYQYAKGLLPNNTRDKFRIWNFDAHHDIFYDKKEKLECDNWAYFLAEEKRLVEYHVVYPKWRRRRREVGRYTAKLDIPVIYHYNVPKMPDLIIAVFICRSSAWTPSWCDGDWMEFIEYWKRFPELWENKSFSEYALKERRFDLEEAERQEAVIEKQRRLIKEKEGGLRR